MPTRASGAFVGVLLSCAGPSDPPSRSPTPIEQAEPRAEPPLEPSGSPPLLALPDDLHHRARALLTGRRFVVLAEDLPWHESRLDPISVADLDGDGTPDVVLEYATEQHVFDGASLAEGSTAAPTAQSLAAARDGATVHAVGSSRDGQERVFVVGRGGHPISYCEGASRAQADCVTVRVAAPRTRFYAAPDIDGDHHDDVVVAAPGHEQWKGDERLTGAIWIVSGAQLHERLSAPAYDRELDVAKEHLRSFDRVGGDDALGFATRAMTLVMGTELVAGSIVSYHATEHRVDEVLLFERHELGRDAPRPPSARCRVALSYPPGTAYDHTDIAGVADFDGDRQLDLVLWERGVNPTTEAEIGRVTVVFGLPCEPGPG